MIMVDSVAPPPEVRRLTVPFDVGWPSEEELNEVVRTTFQEIQRNSIRQVESKLTKRELEMLVQTLRGLTTEEAARVVAGAIQDDYVLDRADLPRDRGCQAQPPGDDGLFGVDCRRCFAG